MLSSLRSFRTLWYLATYSESGRERPLLSKPLPYDVGLVSHRNHRSVLYHLTRPSKRCILKSSIPCVRRPRPRLRLARLGKFHSPFWYLPPATGMQLPCILRASNINVVRYTESIILLVSHMFHTSTGAQVLLQHLVLLSYEIGHCHPYPWNVSPSPRTPRDDCVMWAFIHEDEPWGREEQLTAPTVSLCFARV